MAPSASHLHKLVVKNAKLLKAAWKSTQHLLQNRVPALLRGTGELVAIPVRVGSRQQLHPVAALRQGQNNFSGGNGFRQYTTSANGSKSGPRHNRQLFPKSNTGTAVNTLTGRAPFASTLRPNLTGGAFRRTAGGYSLGSGRLGGARYFSHTPTAPAQVVQNVSQAMRAFFISGNKAQFSGVDPLTGEKRYRAVGAVQDKVTRTVASLAKATPGSFIDFKVNPTITALTSLDSLTGYTSNFSSCEQNINSSGLIDILSVDFSRSLKDLAVILNDLKLLGALGNLPITYRSDSSAIRVHFPGCDLDTVERLCSEIGVQRGVVVEDQDFDAFAGTEIALLFPFAPSKAPSEIDNLFQVKKPSSKSAFHSKNVVEPIDWQNMVSPPRSPMDDQFIEDEYSIRSETGLEPFEAVNPWIDSFPAPLSPEGYESMSSCSERRSTGSPLEYQDFQGIYKFIELCDGSRR